MSVKQFAEKYLAENGYDGLCTDICSCWLGNNFISCGSPMDECEPGYDTIDEYGEQIISSEKPKDRK